jgi:hypothetical protein
MSLTVGRRAIGLDEGFDAARHRQARQLRDFLLAHATQEGNEGVVAAMDVQQRHGRLDGLGRHVQYRADHGAALNSSGASAAMR